MTSQGSSGGGGSGGGDDDLDLLGGDAPKLVRIRPKDGPCELELELAEGRPEDTSNMQAIQAHITTIRF